MKAKRIPAKKLPKGVSQEFVDNIQSMSTDQLKAEIVRLQVQVEENESFKLSEGYLQAEEEFKHAKSIHDNTTGPVKETAVSLRNRTKMLVERLTEKGGA